MTKTNFALSSTATLLSGLGAIFVDPATARGLSGASTIVAGIRGNYNESYLESQTVRVITAGIDLKRAEIRDEINGRRYGPPHTSPKDECKPYYNEEIKKWVPGNGACIANHPYIPLSPYDKYEKQAVPNDITERDRLAAEIKASKSSLAAKEQARNLVAQSIAVSKADLARLEGGVATAANANAALAKAAREANEVTLGELIARIETAIERRNAGIRLHKPFLPNPFDGAVVEQNEAEAKILENAKSCLERKKAESQSGRLDIGECTRDASPLIVLSDAVGSAPAVVQPAPSPTATAAVVPAQPPAAAIKALEDAIAADEAKLKTLDSEIKTLKDQIKSNETALEPIQKRLDNRGVGNEEIVGHVPLGQYTVEMAIADAIRFHAACSIPAGLDAAVDSIEEVADPGFSMMLKALDSINRIQDKMLIYNEGLKGGVSEPVEDGK